MDPGLVFAIILALIVIGFLFAVGTGQVQSLFCIGSNSQITKSVRDLRSAVDEVAILARGSSTTYTLSLPESGKICFINATNPKVQAYTIPEHNWNPNPLVLKEILMNKNATQYGSTLWVYFCGDTLGQGTKVTSLKPERSFCASNGDTILLENRGSSVNVQVGE